MHKGFQIWKMGVIKSFFLDMCQNSLGVCAKLQKPKYNSSKKIFPVICKFIPFILLISIYMCVYSRLAKDINLRILIPP